MSDSEKDSIFKWLNTLKSVHRVSYTRMADILDYSPTGIKKAIKNKTLSVAQVEEIAKYTGYETDFYELFGTDEQKKTPLEDVRFEEMIAGKVVESLKPYLKDFQEGHKYTWKQVQSLTDLIKIMAVRIDAMQDKLDEIDKHLSTDINAIKQAVKAE